jgi:hypothetical protein
VLSQKDGVASCAASQIKCAPGAQALDSVYQQRERFFNDVLATTITRIPISHFQLAPTLAASPSRKAARISSATTSGERLEAESIPV